MPALAIRRCLPIFLLAFATVSVAGGAEGRIESWPLAPRKPAAGATRFATLPPAVTGIHSPNPYDDPRMWGDRYKVFMLGPIGTGVAIADYDGDGRPDVFVTNKCATNRLFRNLGDWRFEDVTDRAGVAGPTDAWKGGVAFADVNNDGRPDLYVCRWNAANLLYINQGDGTFREQALAAGVAVRDASMMAAFCDYDRDGWLDFYLQTNFLDAVAYPDGRRDRLFHNRGDGTFEEVTDRAGIFGETHGHSATWWDFNTDGWPDLYVANDFTPPDQLYRNNGDGTFTDVLAATLPHTPIYAMGSDLGDVDNDGRIDLFVADMLPTDPQRDRRTMIELRERFPDLPDPSWPAQFVRNALYLNTGAARFQEAAELAGIASSDWTWAVRFEDLDNDGRLDLFVTDGMVRDLFENDLTRKIEGFSALEQGRAVKAWPVLREPNHAFRNLGDLQFVEAGSEWGLDHRGVSFGAAFGDLDSDGDLDLVFVNYDAEPTVCRNDGVDGHSLEVRLRGTASNRFGVGATVRIETATGPQVRQLVLARGYMSTSEPLLHFGLGTETTIRQLTVVWPSGSEQTFTDLAADRIYEITEPSDGQFARTVLARPAAKSTWFVENAGELGLQLASHDATQVNELTAQPLLPSRQDPLGPALAIGDLDGDGHDDLVLGGAAGEGLQLCLADGQGRFRPPVSSTRTVGAADAGVAIFDANADGRSDVFVTKGGAVLPADDGGYQPRLLFSRGGGRYQAPVGDALPVFTASAGPAVVADFDRDGQLDGFIGGRVVVGSYGATPRSALWMNRGNRFADETAARAPGLATAGMISGALITDVDQDGWPDLLLARQWDTIQYWHNEAGKGFVDRSAYAGFSSVGSGWWNSLATADFNGDGRLDYVAGNLGLNTPYRASPASPARLYRGDFGAAGREQLVEATVEQGREMPRRGRDKLIATFPALARKLPNYAALGTATLSGLFGAEALTKAQRLEATEFRSGVFLSQPDGTFRFAPLPRIAQVAPVFGMVAADFDGDGCTDLALVQNSFAPIPQVGRFDGGIGQILRGDGRGSFTPAPAAETGFVVPGDGKALALIDRDQDGRPDLVASTHNGRVFLFSHQGSPGGNWFTVALAGPAGHPRALGARITVSMRDGKTQVLEISGGSGYLSQSAAKGFFGYRADNPPREIEVAWPSGMTTRRPWQADETAIQIAETR